MQFLTEQESLARLTRYGYRIGELFAGFPVFRSKQIPVDSGAKIAVARSLASWLLVDEMLLLVAEWDVWPSSQNMNLFLRVRQALGTNEPVNTHPGHIIAPGEHDDLECLVDLCLINFWDATLVNCTKAYAVHISHDEMIDLAWRSDMDASVTPTIELLEHHSRLESSAK